MKFNPSKCQVVRVTKSRSLINTVYSLHGQVLGVVTSAEYLGLIYLVAYPAPYIDRITGTNTGHSTLSSEL